MSAHYISFYPVLSTGYYEINNAPNFLGSAELSAEKTTTFSFLLTRPIRSDLSIICCSWLQESFTHSPSLKEACNVIKIRQQPKRILSGVRLDIRQILMAHMKKGIKR